MITSATRLKIYQILLPSNRQALSEILDEIVDADLIAALDALVSQWDNAQLARNPDKAGVTRVDVIEFDPKAKAHELCQIEARVRSGISSLDWVECGGVGILSTCLDILENAIFYLDMPTGWTVTDPKTGNRLPNQKQIHAHAYLKCNQQPPRELSTTQPNNKPMLWVVGWVVRVIDPSNPQSPFPPTLPDRVGEVIKARVGGVEGRFYPMHNIQSSAVDNMGMRNLLGESLWGWWDAQA